MVTDLNTISKDDIKKIFSEVFDEKLNELKLIMVPSVSEEEMEDITNVYGKIPRFNDEYEDLNFDL